MQSSKMERRRHIPPLPSPHLSRTSFQTLGDKASVKFRNELLQTVSISIRSFSLKNLRWSADSFASLAYSEFDMPMGETDESLSGLRQSRRGSRREDPTTAKTKNRDEPTVPVKRTSQLIIGDWHEVNKLYVDRFQDLNQIACKLMGKAFVKIMEPKKQTHHPYTKGDSQAPAWWPKGVGPEYVPHKEPDHIKKRGMTEKCKLQYTEV